MFSPFSCCSFVVGMVQTGVDKVAELIGVTLGPKGRNVVLQNKYGPPKIVNDGETVLKQVFYLDTHHSIYIFCFLPLFSDMAIEAFI